MFPYSNKPNDHVRNSDPVGSISTCLAGKFVKPLFDFYNESIYIENKHETYLICLAEILTWSQEFYDLYYNNKNDWEISAEIKNTIYNNGVHRNEFLLAWGDKRMKQFLAKHYVETECSEPYKNVSPADQQVDFSVGITIDADRKKIISDGENVDAWVDIAPTFILKRRSSPSKKWTKWSPLQTEVYEKKPDDNFNACFYTGTSPDKGWKLQQIAGFTIRLCDYKIKYPNWQRI